jgi:PAS domain S-box-containing protein
MEESSLWRERYRVLFDRSVAGIILTNVEGRIIDCNEPCARIVGFIPERTCLLTVPGFLLSLTFADRQGHMRDCTTNRELASTLRIDY